MSRFGRHLLPASFAGYALGIVAMIVGATPSPADTGFESHTAQTPTGLALVEQTAWVEPQGDFRLRLDVADSAGEGEISVFLHDRPIGRDQFADGLEGGFLGSEIDNRCAIVTDAGLTPRDPCRFLLSEAVPDADGAFSIAIAISDTPSPGRTHLTGEGAYPVRVELADANGPVDTLITHLLRLPDTESTAPPLAVALIAEIAAPPARQPDESVVPHPPTANEFSALFAASSVHPAVPLNLRLTPEPLVAWTTATGWIAPQPDPFEDDQIFRLPYQDLDVGAWWSAGRSLEVADQFIAGAAAQEQAFGRPPDPGAWIMTNTTTGVVLDQLSDELAVTGVVVPEQLLEPLPESQFPLALDQPFLVTSASGRSLDAVMADDALAAHLRDAPDSRLAAHRLLADLTLLYSQRPSTSRGVAVLLPPSANADSAMLDVLLTALDNSAMIEPVTLNELFERTDPLPSDPSVEDSLPLTRPVTTVNPPLIDEYLIDRVAANARRPILRDFIGDDPALELRIEEAFRLSASQHLSRDQWIDYLGFVDRELNGLASEIEVPPQETITLTSRDVTIPFTIMNNATRSLNVNVHLQSPKLTFPNGDLVAVTLAPGENRVMVRVQSLATGAFPVEVDVTTPDSSISLAAGRFRMRSTAVPGIGFALSGLAFGFLALWWARHWRTAKRYHRLVGAESSPDPEDVTADP